ncbi:AAA family ATPase [Kineosporia sp. A_224]|uniref:AAA family ATPase n=1 Tax=Kineosporia sp. A_224 TaxID=1962180 RepID=UPI0018EA2996|nr:AAA family ATPase [Kineosporia sp. A_224]
MTLVLIALVAVVTVAIVVVLAVALTTMTRSMNRIEQAVRPGAQPPPTAQTAVLPAAVAQPAVVTGASAPAAVAVAAPAPATAADADPRFPWKVKGTRKPLGLWDRVKFLLLLGVVLGLLVWNEYLRISPLGGWGEASSNILRENTWLPTLVVVELLRQLHFVVSERWAGYHRFWSEKVFGRTTRWWERRFNPWNRYRLARVFKWVVVIALGAFVLGKVTGAPPVFALFQAPARIIAALPMIIQYTFIIALGILQFAAIFWFMSRGGVETYFPEDIEKRFSDVWGQDHVLERVKENIVLLENPEAIEARGGHVPSGILLWGPPGTGKTLMAEAVAGETGKPYVFVDPGAFNNMFFGVGILKVKALFRKLRKLALRYGGVIVFFDEADSLGSRGAGAGTPGMASTPAPAAHACHGLAHLSEPGRSLLADRPWEAERASTAGRAPRSIVDRVIVPNMNGGGGGMGTLQALLTELSGLTKPRGFVNRVLRRTLGMRPKPPPKYRILVMMASNLPEALDPALLRPGRLDRIYRVGYPSKAGRVRTYEGYFSKVNHELTAEQIDKLATITPYATGATIKDLVNESLIYAISEDRDVVTWADVLKAKQRKQLGPPEDVEYIERERHAVAVHEACHAVLAWRTRAHYDIDLATIEKGSTYLGMVASVKTEDQFTRWRSEHESDILVSLASLAGERLFFEGDNSSGVSGDLESATYLAALMESQWGMGSSITSLPALQQLEIGAGGPEPRGKQTGSSGVGFGAQLGGKREEPAHAQLGQRIEQNLSRLFEEAERYLRENRAQVLALAHALETHKTLNGEDVVAVLEQRRGPLVDGTFYADPAFAAELEAYHAAAVDAHRNHAPVATSLPQPQPAYIPGRLVAAAVPAPEQTWPAQPATTQAAEPVPAGAPGSAAPPLSWGLRPPPAGTQPAPSAPPEQNGSAAPEPEPEEDTGR